MLNAPNLGAYLGMQAGSAVKLARTRRQSLALRQLLWAGAGGAACSALAGLVIMLFRPPLARGGAASVLWSATVSAVAGVAGITFTHSVGSAAAFAPPQKPTHGSLNGHADASPPGRGRCGRDAPLVLAQSHADWTREKMPKTRVDFIFPREAKIRGGPGVTGGAELPSREVVCAEAVAWMEAQDELPGSLFTSMPDISEVEMRPAEYKEWFTRAAALAMRKLPPRSFALFYQTDVKARAFCSLPRARAGPARGPPAQGRRGAESHGAAGARGQEMERKSTAPGAGRAIVEWIDKSYLCQKVYSRDTGRCNSREGGKGLPLPEGGAVSSGGPEGAGALTARARRRRRRKGSRCCGAR